MSDNPIRDLFASKADFYERSKRSWNPGKTQFWQDAGVDLCIDRREGYVLQDFDGHRLVNLHLNGGTYNLGHRNAELVQTLKDALDHFDMGNHHFPALARTALAERLHAVSPQNLVYSIYGSGGGEAIDIALKSARHAAKKRKIVSIIKAYHGHTGLAVCTGDERFSRLFLADRPDEFVQVPFNDLDAMETALRGRDVAAVIMETIPATYGFPMPKEGYLKGVKALCERYDAFYIADEVQTGLMRTGEMWAITKYGVTPDILVSAKGIGGGLYSLGCVLVSEETGAWMREDGFGHISTGGGAELACVVAMKVLEITDRPEVRANVASQTVLWSEQLAAIRRRHADFFTGIRQNGLVMGLEFDHPQGAKFVMKALYDNGVWAIFSTLDPRVLQWKPGLLKTAEQCRDVLERLDRSIAIARKALPKAA
ncbi:MAG: aminotransferase class III-fold pyridoxal phosphate-dependent enzyme [Geminicoccaceae bacterium]